MVATTGLSALFMILRYRTKTRGELPQESVEKLLESQEQILNVLEDLREDIHSGQEEVRELSGRVEFAERLLAKPKDDPS